MSNQEARYYEIAGEDASGGEGAVRCTLCPHNCRIRPGQAGICRARRNEGGVLKSLIYGRVAAIHLDPIEKKPLYHFHPGKMILSAGAFGCNLNCQFCQNWELVEGKNVSLQEASPEVLLEHAEKTGSIGIAYTYNEPVIWFEFIMDSANIFHRAGLKNVLVTNGFCNPDPWMEMLPLIDAMNIDLKSIRDEFYRKNCFGRLDPVKRSIEQAVKYCHVELTNLLIPRHNDSTDEIRDLVDFVASLGKEIPLHFSRYHPCYHFREPPTPAETLHRAYDLARERLDYVYIGNLVSEQGQDTRCPQCGSLLIQRTGYRTEVDGLSHNRCRKCGREIEIVV